MTLINTILDLLVFEKDITGFIPQKPPMVMVDNLVDSNEEISRSTFSIKRSNIFCRNDVLQEPGLVENIAQTMALLAGYYAKLKNQPVKTGYIGSVKRLKLYELPRTGSVMHTTIKILHEVMSATIVKGMIHVDETLLAECEMTIFTDK